MSIQRRAHKCSRQRYLGQPTAGKHLGSPPGEWVTETGVKWAQMLAGEQNQAKGRGGWRGEQVWRIRGLAQGSYPVNACCLNE